ncbi:MAG: DUF2062 domain-containing protein [Alphaproteobacteria bacterium]|nr:DUF2062 domain-containing protein [Alphaproteobacteria bacterium]
MFKRRKARSTGEQIRSVVWPDRGFARLFSYIFQRVRRMPGSPTSIAVGAAWGVAVSFTPFIGLHLFVGLAMTYMTRGNMLACLFCTIIGNPWTFPLFFYLDYALGTFILQFFGSVTIQAGNTLAEFISLFLAAPTALIGEVFKQIIVGAIVLGSMAWFMMFGIVYWAVSGWRKSRSLRLATVRERLQNEEHENDNLRSEQPFMNDQETHSIRGDKQE